MSSPKYEVTYFDARGRGEFVRLILESQGVAYKDTRVQFADWPTVKATTPFGSLPILKINRPGGKTVTIPQTYAIIRCLGRELNMYGKGNDEATDVDVLLETAVDLLNSLINTKFESDEAKKKEKMEKFDSEGYKDFFGKFEKLLAQSGGKKGYAVGDSLTVADLALYHVLEMSQKVDKIGEFKLLQANRKFVGSQDKLAKYIKGRKEAAF